MRRIGKYACREVERRYLLNAVPAGLDDGRGWHIVDRYIDGTRLRLRRMEALAGDEVVCKLGQKYRAEGQSAVETTMTNLYLSQTEHAALAQLAARVLVKTRSPYFCEGRAYSIDVFEGHLAGLVLAETECESLSECAQLQTPPFALREVTEEPFFDGANLASLAQGVWDRVRDEWLRAGRTDLERGCAAH